MSRWFVAVLSVIAAVSASAAPAELVPNDFAYGAKVMTSGDAAAFRVSLPLWVYQNVTQGDLGDVGVFNERNELVPYRIERPSSQAMLQTASTPLPIFVLRDDSREALDAIRVTIESGGARVKADTSGSQGTQPGARYIFDGRALERPVAALQLSWPGDAASFAGRVRVEASDDLGTWLTVAADAPIANLRAGDAHILERRVEVHGASAKFWRLSWSGTPAPFEITGVSAEPALDRVDVMRSSLAVTGAPVAEKRGEFEFDIGARVPVDRVNLELPEQNSVVQVELFSRAEPTQPWLHVIRGGFYRLKNAASTDLTNGPYVIDPRGHRYWLARVDVRGGGLGQGSPKLSVGWLPHDVVFLARGAGPFTLVYGSRKTETAGSLGAIPDTVAIVPARLAEPQTLGGAARIGPERRSWALGSKSAILWAVLAIGVALLAFMAYRLSRELK